MKKKVSVLLAVLMAFAVLFSPLVNEAEAEAAHPIEVTVGISSDFSDMSPFGGQSAGKQYYKWMIYGYLCLNDNNGVLTNVLAKEMTFVDNLTVDVEIYDYIHDSKGNHITADDVIWSFQSAKDSGNFTGQGPSFIDHMEKTGDYSVRFYFTQDNLSTTRSYLNNVPITSRAAYEASGDNMAVNIAGCGRYEITEFTAGSTLVLSKVQDFWQKDDLYSLDQLGFNADKVILKYIPEAAQMSIALETQTIDIAGSLSGTEAARFMDESGNVKPGYNMAVIEPTQSTILLFNGKEGGIMDNQALRQAILYAINTDAMVSILLNGRGYSAVTYGSSRLRGIPAKWAEEDYYEYNLETAKEKMKEAGYDPNGQLELHLVADGNAVRGRAAQIIQGSLAQIGIKVNIDTYETALFNTYKNDDSQWDMLIDTKNGQDFIVNCWRSSFDSRAFSTGATVNFVKDDKLQELVAAAIDPTTYSEETVDAFHQYLKEQAYAYGLYITFDYAVSVDTIENIFINSSNYICPAAFTYGPDYVGVSTK